MNRDLDSRIGYLETRVEKYLRNVDRGSRDDRRPEMEDGLQLYGRVWGDQSKKSQLHPVPDPREMSLRRVRAAAAPLLLLLDCMDDIAVSYTHLTLPTICSV